MSDNVNKGKGSIILKVLIAVLAVILYFIITTPWDAKLEADKKIVESRKKMSYIRAGEIAYISQHGVYSNTVEEMINFIKNDPLLSTQIDSVFNLKKGVEIDLNTLNVCPITNTPYIYQVDNTSAVRKYYLKCPGSDNSIGSMTDDDKVNKSSWEN